MSDDILTRDDLRLSQAEVCVHRIVLEAEGRKIPIKDGAYFVDQRITRQEMRNITNHSDRRIGIIEDAFSSLQNAGWLKKIDGHYALDMYAPFEVQQVRAPEPSSRQPRTAKSSSARKKSRDKACVKSGVVR